MFNWTGWWQQGCAPVQVLPLTAEAEMQGHSQSGAEWGWDTQRHGASHCLLASSLSWCLPRIVTLVLLSLTLMPVCLVSWETRPRLCCDARGWVSLVSDVTEQMRLVQARRGSQLWLSSSTLASTPGPSSASGSCHPVGRGNLPGSHTTAGAALTHPATTLSLNSDLWQQEFCQHCKH